MPGVSGLRSLARFFPTVLGAAAGGLNTHDLWSAVQNAAYDQVGKALTGITIMDMNVLRGLAGSQLEAARQFEAAGDVQGITASMWANELDQRSYSVRMATPEWVVRFVHTYTDANGETGEDWRTTVWNRLPSTKAALLDQLMEDAEGIEDSYGVTTLSVGNVMITQR